MSKLSIVLATYNEESNILDCLNSIKDIASEIIIVDGSSNDKTVEIAKEFGAKVTITDNPPIFHINKQKALDQAKYDWILQLDADERVSKELSKEITAVINMSSDQLVKHQEGLKDRHLFLRNQSLLEESSGKVGDNQGDLVAFFLPRLNYFLGKYLKYGGVYPDGAIRLVKRDQAHFPCKSVHEIMEVKGRVGWLGSPLYHVDSPTFDRYLSRNKRYINLIAKELERDKVAKNVSQFINYCLIKPLHWFLLTVFRHKGLLDGWQGIVFSFFSALRFPRAYLQFLFSKETS